jgi:hypothetical protein
MPLTEKGSEIMSNMKEQYGSEKGEQVFYASKNKGKISGVDSQDLPLQNLMEKLMGKFAKDEDNGGGARAAPPMRPEGKEVDAIGVQLSGDKRAFFKGAFKDARRFLSIGDSFKYALDQIKEAEEAPPMRPTGDRAAQLRWAMDQVGMNLPRPEGTQRAVKAPKGDSGTAEGARKAAQTRGSGGGAAARNIGRGIASQSLRGAEARRHGIKPGHQIQPQGGGRTQTVHSVHGTTINTHEGNSYHATKVRRV